MRIRSLRAARVLAAVAAAGLVSLAAAGCTAGSPSASPTPSGNSGAPTSAPSTVHTTPNVPNVPSATGLAGTPGSAKPTVPAEPTVPAKPVAPAAPAKAVTVQQLKFPNTNATVLFTGYDAKDKLAEFQQVAQNPKVPYADLIPDPKDPTIHRLPLAPGTNVTSIDPDGFPFETCPPFNCTSDDVIQNVMSHTTLWAHIHVNAADQIDTVNEIAY
jgi:hypothetical protein